MTSAADTAAGRGARRAISRQLKGADHEGCRRHRQRGVERRRTIEYRYFDSSLDPARLQANIKLACWLTKRAGELQDSSIPRERVRLDTHSQQADEHDRLLRRFADLVFVRPRDKLKLYWVYERSSWQQPA
jgi:hypothetical protein